MLGYIVIAVIFSGIGMYLSNKLKRKFTLYSKMPINSGMTGREVALAMLRHYGIQDVKIVQGQGMLTDHYNPLSKTVSLSPAVYQGRSVAAAAVAAHECGHAVQHAKKYAWLQFRSAIVPIVSFASRAQQYLLMAALFGMFAMNSGSTLLLITIIAFAITTLFSFVTLPVEFDASRRALVWLDETGTASGSEYTGAKDALKWAAMTYVSAALSSLAILLYLLLNFAGGD